MADQDDLPLHFVRPHADVLQEPDMNRVVEERMKIQEHIDTWLRHGTNMLENVGRLRVDRLWLERDIETLEPVGNRPSEKRCIGLARPLQRDRLQQAEHALFVLRLDHDDRRARSQDQFEVMTSIHQGIIRQPGSLSM